MSYYTIIFPEGEFEGTDITEVEKEIQKINENSIRCFNLL